MNALALSLGSTVPSRPDCFVLRPFDRREALTVSGAVEISGFPQSTVYWLVDHRGIGRRVAGRVLVSKIALAALLDGREDVLRAYLAGDRESAEVLAYFRRLGVPVPQ
jgi:hypothetical protein